jgi:predicted TIM-barrel fold metal-dependent hydrolase
MTPARRVVDAHTHAFSPDVLKGRDRIVQSDHWFGLLYGNPKARAVSAGDVLDAARAAGVDRSILCGFPWSDEGRCRAENEWMAEATFGHPELDWLGIVVPGDSSAANDAAWCLEHGACGIGELNADGQGVSLLAAEVWTPLIEVARSHNRPLMLHASEAPGHRYPGKGTATPEKWVEWLGSAQDIDVILAHWGGGLPFYELMPEVHNLTRRVFYDSAATTYLYDFQVFPRVIDLVGADRVLFGTDFPLLKQGRFIQRSEASLRGSNEVRAVMAGNADRLYRSSMEGSNL